MPEQFVRVSDQIELCYESFGDPADPTLPLIRPLIALTISGLSAALQGTG